jgi:hypothetical protein
LNKTTLVRTNTSEEPPDEQEQFQAKVNVPKYTLELEEEENEGEQPTVNFAEIMPTNAYLDFQDLKQLHATLMKPETQKQLQVLSEAFRHHVQHMLLDVSDVRKPLNALRLDPAKQAEFLDDLAVRALPTL